ncbi:MAG: TlpA family protein disulfide reductase [Flavobacteriales bacterium]|nr:TlpA family protein disulfide reductase [Flavobacteriales bacterium]
MIRAFRLTSLFLLLFLAGCEALPEPEDPKLIEGLPTMEDLADSLQLNGSNVIKWVIQDGGVQHAFQDSVNWRREFTAFMQDDVNHLRYKDAYAITDTTIGPVREVIFKALSDGQEVREMRYVIERGRLIGFELLKERSNLLSSSAQSFQFDRNEYSLSIKQSIDWFFQNDQFIQGSIVPRGELWRAVFDLGGDPLPVQCILQEGALIVKNDKELLRFPLDETKGDSLTFASAYFNAYFRLKRLDETTLIGRWVNEKRDERRITPVRLERGVPYRFPVAATTSHKLQGEHTLLFADDNGDFTDSTVLVIEQTEQAINGSILTETGDYRFLDGAIRGDSFFLSTMDGTHAYLFKGSIKNDSLIGVFCAGQTWKQPWVALLNSSFELRAAESITTLKNDRFTFSFPDTAGRLVSLSDRSFENKVTLVSVMGTWCSNCLDETLFLKKVRSRYPSEDLEIVALDFELVRDSAIAKRNIQRQVKNLQIPYPVLLASLSTTKEKAASILPALSGVFSYPTLLVLDRQHDVVKIHTGFSGPATGKARYLAFETYYFDLLDSLVGP